MLMEEVIENNAPSMGLDGMGWGGFLNPVRAIQHAAAVVQAHTPAPLRRLSPIGIVQRQVADIKRVKASQLRMARNKQAAMMALAARTPLGKRLMPGGDGGSQSGSQVSVDIRAQQAQDRADVQAQAAADAKAQAEYDAQYPPDSATLPTYDTMPVPGGSYAGGRSYATDVSQLDAPASDLYADDTMPGGSSVLDTSGDYQFDPFNDTQQGDTTMQLNNIRSTRLFPSDTFKESGMGEVGDIWGDLMTSVVAYTGQKSAVQIQQSQAAQADAVARTAAAQAAIIASSKGAGSMSPVVLIGGAVALGGLLFFLKRRGKR